MNELGTIRYKAASLLAVTTAAAAVMLSHEALEAARQNDALRKALTFHASFDGSVDAVHAAGNPRLYTAPSLARRQEAKPGLPDTGETRLAAGEGKFGDALRFTVRRKPPVYFEGARNLAYDTSNWSGTVSFWLSVDPAAELDPGFCDPVQITPRAWNDAAFFVEFEKRPDSIPFRLGVYADFKVWNPSNRKFEEIPASERPLVTVEKPPFGRGKWTHVVFTFERFNTGQPDGRARLYLDGSPAGDLSPRMQTFTWDERTAVALGLSYVGLLDELSLFNRALTPAEVQATHNLKTGVVSLLK
jgi:hypothetical protein